MKSLTHTSHSLVGSLLLIFALSNASLAQHQANIDKAGNLVVTNTDHALTLENLRTGQTTPVKPLQVTEAPPPPASNYSFGTVPAPPRRSRQLCLRHQRQRHDLCWRIRQCGPRADRLHPSPFCPKEDRLSRSRSNYRGRSE